MDKQLVFENLNSAYKVFVRLSDSEYEIQDIPYDLAYSGLNHFIFNYVRLKNLDPKRFEELLDYLKAPFLCLPASNLDEEAFSTMMQHYNLIKIDDLMGQYLDNLQDFPYQSPQEEIQIKLMTSEEDLEILDVLCQDAYEHEKNLAKKMFKGIITQTPEESRVYMFLAYWQGEPVGKAALVTCDNLAGLYWDSVLPPFRRRGIATALIRTRLEVARMLGYTEAIVQTRTPAFSCYQRLGFKLCGSLPFFKRLVETN